MRTIWDSPQTVTIGQVFIFKWRFPCRCRRHCWSSLVKPLTIAVVNGILSMNDDTKAETHINNDHSDVQITTLPGNWKKIWHARELMHWHRSSKSWNTKQDKKLSVNHVRKKLMTRWSSSSISPHSQSNAALFEVIVPQSLLGVPEFFFFFLSFLSWRSSEDD